MYANCIILTLKLPCIKVCEKYCMDPVLGFIPANYFKLADRPHQGGIGGAFFMYNDTKNLLTKILDVRSNNILITIYFT